MGIIYSILIGGLSGWLAGKIKKGAGFGVFKNIIIGIIGGALGNWIFGQIGLDLNSSLWTDLFTGVVGALVVLGILSLFKKKS